MNDDKEGDELVRKLAELEKKKESEPPPELTSEVVINLAGLTPLQYAQQIAREAKKYKTPVRLLEKAVEAARVEIEVEKLLEPHWEVTPAEDPVDAARVFADIEARILHHIAMPKHLAFVCALWVGYSWIHEHATYSPILFITSAERDSGKTTLSAILGFMVRRSLLSVGISPAALYRSIEKWHPSFVIDEADKAFAKSPDLAEVVNSGWTRGQTIVRCDPDTHEPRTYSTFCPKIVALKGKEAPDPTLSRAIFISMKRRTRSEPIADFAHIDDDGFRRLRSQLARWADDNGAVLGLAAPAMPDGFMNRTAANWKLIFAIADSFGAGDRAREAARRILGVTDMPSAGVTLLEDIKIHFDRSTLDYVTSEQLIKDLTADPERPWAEWGHGKPITQKGVGGLLHDFQIKSREVGPRDHRAKGYRRADFTDAWGRYLPAKKEEDEEKEEAVGQETPNLPFTGSQRCNHYENAGNLPVHRDPREREKINAFANETNTVNVYTAKTPLPARPLSSSASTPREDAPQNGNGAAADSQVNGIEHGEPDDDGLSFPDDLRRCTHCGKNGAVPPSRVVLPDRAVWLHRECEGPWMEGNR